MTSTALTRTTDQFPQSGDTRLVSVLPYAYMPMEDRIRYANTMAGARGLLPSGMKDAPPAEVAARLFLIFETGAMLGLHPMAALQGMDVIEGNVTISPQTFTALVRGAGHKLRIKESGTLAEGTFRVDVTLIRSDDPDEPVEASWSLEDSVQAGLVELVTGPRGYTVKARSSKGNALNHEKYPKDMTMWRALGRLARRGAADVTMGIGYFPEELEVAVNEEGTRIDFTEFSDALIEETLALDDKADMERLWLREHPFGADEHRHPTDAWTQRVEAEFATHLAGLTKDSRPPKAGAPGQTGDADFDQHTAQPSDYDDAELVNGQVRSKEYEANRAALETQAEIAVVETDEAREARIEHENYLAAVAEGAVESGEMTVAESDALERQERASRRAALDFSALEQ